MISVLLPVFNGERYLDGCIAAVLAQTDRDLELVIVDDASTDASWPIIGAWAERDPRVRIERLPRNTRKNGAYARAIAIAKGEWLLEVNADDELLPDALATLRVAADQYPSAAAVFADHDYVDAEGRPDERQWRAAAERSGRSGLAPGFVDGIVASQLRRNVLTTSVCLLVRASVLADFPDFTDAMTDYWASWLIARTDRVVYVDTVLAHYRRHEGSESASASYYSRAQARARIEMYLRILPAVRSPALVAFLIARLLRSLVLIAVGARYSQRLPRHR